MSHGVVRQKGFGLAALTPPPALLNILIGVLTAAAVNLLTTLSTSEVRNGKANWIAVASILFALAAGLMSALSLSLTRLEREVQLLIGQTLTTEERRAVLLSGFSAHLSRTVVLFGSSVLSCVAAGIMLAAAR